MGHGGGDLGRLTFGRHAALRLFHLDLQYNYSECKVTKK